MTRLLYDETGRPIPVFKLGASQDVPIGGASNPSVAFGSKTTAIRLNADVDCRYAIGSNPTATPTSTRLPAGAIDYVGCAPGDKIAVLQETNGGTLNVTEAD